ncbi:MAG: hypothetical protein WC732_09740 [Candidatus Omnitrophota bacterium]
MVTNATPAQQAVRTINGILAQTLLRTQLARPDNGYYITKLGAAGAPIVGRLRRGLVAMLANISFEDMSDKVESLPPFFVAYNFLAKSTLEQPPIPLGVIITDQASDDGMQPVAIQTGGVCTIVNTGTVTIPPGALVAVRPPLSQTPSQRCEANEEGVVRPETFPLQFGSGGMESETVKFVDTVHRISTDFRGGLRAGHLLSDAIEECLAVGAANASLYGAMLLAFGLGVAHASEFGGGTPVAVGKRLGLVGPADPDAQLSVQTKLVDTFDGLAASSDFMLSFRNMFSWASMAGRSAMAQTESAILGRAVTGADPGNAFDIMLGGGYVI